MQILGFNINIPDFLNNYLQDPTQKAIAYAVIYALIGLAIAYGVKTKLKVKKPKNVVNLIGLAGGGFAAYIQTGIPEIGVFIVIGGFIAAEVVGMKLFPLAKNMVYILETEKKNIMVDDMVFYNEANVLCVALQDNWSTLKRIILNQRVLVKINATTEWTEDYDSRLWLCNKWTLYEVTLNETPTTSQTETDKSGYSTKQINTEPQQGAKARINKFFFGQKQVVLELDVCDAHVYSRIDLITNTKTLEFAVEKLEKTLEAYTKLRVLLTAFLIKKNNKMVLSALKTFEESIQLTQEEREKFSGIKKKLDEQNKAVDDKQKKLQAPKPVGELPQ